MKKANNINLNEQIFNIDEDAVKQLQDYIEILERHYFKEEDGREIMNDIESRIAELFTEYTEKQHKSVISIQDVAKIIETLGSPDIIINEDPETSPKMKKNKVLYRDIDCRLIGGVASGVSHRFAISVIIIRLIFIALLFLFGISFFIYIILWIIIPAAKTSSQKIEMQGEKIDISNIEKNIRENYERKEKKGKVRTFFSYIEKKISRLLNFIGKIIKKILQILFNVIAIFGMLSSITALLFLFWIVLFSNALFETPIGTGILYSMPSDVTFFSQIVATIILIIPLLLVLYFSLKHLFHFKSKSYIPLYTFVVWFLSIITGITIGIDQWLNFSQRQSCDVNTTLEIQPIPQSSRNSKSITIQRYNIVQDSINTYTGKYYHPISIFGTHYMKLTRNNEPILLNQPVFLVTQSNNKTIPELQITKRAYGRSEINAFEYIKHIKYNWELQHDTLYLDSYFSFPAEPWRAQIVYITLTLPEGYIINLDKQSAEDVWRWNIRGHEKYNNKKYATIPQRYIMKSGKLEIL